jgi:anti-anti-sigma regulatory factor
MPAQLAKLGDVAASGSTAQIDMTDVERIDFIFAGALFNSISRIESQGKAVQIVGATPIVRALLLLIGISPRHFVKKPD